METVTVSKKFQVVISRRIRKMLGVEAGQKVQMIPHEGRIEIIPLKPIQEACGFLNDIDTIIEREPDWV